MYTAQTTMLAVSVSASKNHDIQENIRRANKRIKDIERIPDWENGIADILTYLAENPNELIYDPVDDEISESFKLERFLAVRVRNREKVGAHPNEVSKVLYYLEFD